MKPVYSLWFKALSLWQPWATLMVIGAKRIETRSWSTSYRGHLLIHAAGRWMSDQFEYLLGNERAAEALHGAGYLLSAPGCPRFRRDLPLGAIIGSVELVDVVRTEDVSPTCVERSFGDFEAERWAWLTEKPVVWSEPWPLRGQRRLFDVNVARIPASNMEVRAMP